MLSDLERKIHRILYNYAHSHRRMPSMQELMTKTGKSSGKIENCLISLEDKLYITWEDKKQVESIQLLQGGEPKETKYAPATSHNNMDYWTQH